MANYRSKRSMTRKLPGFLQKLNRGLVLQQDREAGSGTPLVGLRRSLVRKWFRAADAFLSASSGKPLLFAQVNFLKASFLWWRRDTEAATRLLDDILPIVRDHGSKEFLARTLLLAAEIRDCTGHPDRALPLLDEAVALSAFVEDSYTVFSANFNLALVYTRLSMATMATAQIKEVRKLARSVENEISPFYMPYLEGLVLRTSRDFKGAEQAFSESREGFLNQGLDIYASLVALELSLIYLELRDPEKAFLAATSAIPSISQYGAHEEAIVALTLLQEVERIQRVDMSVVRQVLHHLDMVRMDPAVNFLQ